MSISGRISDNQPKGTHFLDRVAKYLFGIPEPVLLPGSLEQALRQRLALVVARLMLVFGIPVNAMLAGLFYQQVYVTRTYPVSVAVNHVFWFFAGSLLAVILLVNKRAVLALYTIVTAAFASVFIQIYLTNDVGTFVGMLLIMATPTIVFSVRENVWISSLLIVGAAIMRFGFGLEGDFWGAVLVFSSIELSFVTLGEGIRRVLRQTIADQESATAQAVRAEAAVAQADQVAVERERDRFTRDLHDRLGNAFTSIGVQAEVAVRALPNDMPLEVSAARAALLNVQQLADTGVDRLRRTIRNLRDEAVLQCSLPELVERELKELRQTGVQTALECPPSFPTLSPDIVGELLRVVQEALTNVQRHARATAVTVYLDHRESKSVSLIIEDNGQGCDPSCATTGFGLQGIQERVAALGGVFHPWTAPGQGFQVIVEVPLCV